MHIFSLLRFQWHHLGSLKLTTVGLFTPWKLSNTTNHSFFICLSVFREPVVKPLPSGDFPGNPVVKTPCFHCRGARFWSLIGELRPCMPGGKKKFLPSHRGNTGCPPSPSLLPLSLDSGLRASFPLYFCLFLSLLLLLLLSRVSRVRPCATP